MNFPLLLCEVDWRGVEVGVGVGGVGDSSLSVIVAVSIARYCLDT
jgi:hypothetical protein